MSPDYDTLHDFLYRKACYLDDKSRDAWLASHVADASF